MFVKFIQSANLRLKRSLRFIFIVLLVFLVISLIRNIMKISQVGKRIDEASLRVEKLKEENLQLSERLDEVQSELYIESELRDKLGLAKEGETILVLPEEDIVRSLAPKLSQEEEILPDPNWKKWLKLFF
jgi:cell division protein FtsB